MRPLPPTHLVHQLRPPSLLAPSLWHYSLPKHSRQPCIHPPMSSLPNLWWKAIPFISITFQILGPYNRISGRGFAFQDFSAGHSHLRVHFKLPHSNFAWHFHLTWLHRYLARPAVLVLLYDNKRTRKWGAYNRALLVTLPLLATEITYRQYQREIYSWSKLIPSAHSPSLFDL